MADPDDKINDKNPKQVWLKLKDKFSNYLIMNLVWLNTKFVYIKNRLISFLIKICTIFNPKEWNIDKNAWLSSTDIGKVMKGYEDNYKDYIILLVLLLFDFNNKLSKNSCVYNFYYAIFKKVYFET